MKKILLALIFGLTTLSLYAQSAEKPKLFKYVSTGHDGAVVFTVIDDSRKPSMTIESVEDFYKYQLVDLKTGEVVLTLLNKGKTGSIDKTNLTAGDYNLLVFTKSFIIGSEITVTPPAMTSSSVAINVDDN